MTLPLTGAGPAATGAAGPLAADDFNRADNATSMGTTSVGAKAWSNAAAVWGISSNQAYLQSGTNGFAIIDVGVPDVDVSVAFSVVNSGQVPGVVARYTDASNWLRLIQTGASTVKTYVDGALVHNVTTGLSTGNGVGLFASATGTHRWDTFSVSAG
jgi:hypothetical protein